MEVVHDVMQLGMLGCIGNPNDDGSGRKLLYKTDGCLGLGNATCGGKSGNELLFIFSPFILNSVKS